MRGLYAIADVDFLRSQGVSPLLFAEAVLSTRPAVLQLRAKSDAPRDVIELLRALRPICDRCRVPLFANDRPDLAVLAGCDGVHVGQEDLEVRHVRDFAPRLLVGVSTHSPVQLEEALSAEPDYVAYGPVFATTSKANPDPVVGIDGLKVAGDRARAAGVPLVAIGGIDLLHAPEVAPHADMGAVIRALLPPEGLVGVGARADALIRALGGDGAPFRRS
ncbi:MAG TPA: thiamine phosphate synthase [Polyangiaceae bacterium]|nr:thiamine phosphate synthase [Polyangiaceae bacterium]